MYMSLWGEYIAYLKDNPEGYWFKRKLYGWGWTPATREGWLVLFGYVALVLGVVVCVERRALSLLDDTAALALILAATVLFLVIVWRTGESPRWQWGEPTEDNQ